MTRTLLPGFTARSPRGPLTTWMTVVRLTWITFPLMTKKRPVTLTLVTLPTIGLACAPDAAPAASAESTTTSAVTTAVRPKPFTPTPLVFPANRGGDASGGSPPGTSPRLDDEPAGAACHHRLAASRRSPQ